MKRKKGKAEQKDTNLCEQSQQQILRNLQAGRRRREQQGNILEQLIARMTTEIQSRSGSTLPKTLSDLPLEWGGSHRFTETVFGIQRFCVALLLGHSQTNLKDGSVVQRPPPDEIDLEVDPIHLINFKALQMSKIETAIKIYDEANAEFKRKCVNLRPLRNYLAAKKSEENSSCFSALLLDKIPGSQSDDKFFHVKFNEEFLQRLAKMFKNPAVSVLMRMECYSLNRNFVYQAIFRSNGGKSVPVAAMLMPGDLFCRTVLRKASMRIGSSLEEVHSWNYSWILRIEADNAPVEQTVLQPDTNSILLKLYRMDDSKDFSICARNGVQVKCHKCILMAQGDSFASFLSTGHSMAEKNEFLMENNNEEAVRLFVQFLYGIEIPLEENISSDPNLALELLQIANAHGVQALESSIADFLTQQGMNYFTPDTILELFVCTEVPESLKELNAHAFAEISTLPVETLRECEYFKQGSQTAQEILFRLLLKLRN